MPFISPIYIHQDKVEAFPALIISEKIFGAHVSRYLVWNLHPAENIPASLLLRFGYNFFILAYCDPKHEASPIFPLVIIALYW
jgi:hypothetical protein